MDESDIFYADPAEFTRNALRERRPTHLVFFEALLPSIKDVIEAEGYSSAASFFNSHFSDDSRRTGNILVWKNSDDPAPDNKMH